MKAYCLTFLSLFIFKLSFSQLPELDVAGGIKVKGNNTLEFGVGVPKQLDAGKIAYDRWTPNALEFVGGGLNDATRKLKFWNEGGAHFVGNVGVGVANPTQSIDASGLVYSRQGIMFPDQTIQVTASNNQPTYPYQNATSQRQPFALIVSNLSPNITDTLEIVELLGGGIQQSISVGTGGSIEAGRLQEQEFSFLINMENATQDILRKMTQVNNPPKITIYFPDQNSNVFQKTIELRNAYISSMAFKSQLKSPGDYANLVEISLTYAQIEVRTINSNSCFCWNFAANTTCNCD